MQLCGGANVDFDIDTRGRYAELHYQPARTLHPTATRTSQAQPGAKRECTVRVHAAKGATQYYGWPTAERSPMLMAGSRQCDAS